MTLQEIREAKAAAERDILGRLVQLQHKTGMTPIAVELITLTHDGRVFMLNRVDITLEKI